jgi:hypothetical protein
MDDTNANLPPGVSGPGYWYDSKLGNNIAYHACTFQTFGHRVLSFSSRLRYDIAPGSLCQIFYNDDLFAQQRMSDAVKARQCYFGILAEARTRFGGSGGQSDAVSILTFSHVHNVTEREYWNRVVHPLYNETFAGNSLIEGVQ